MPDTHRLLTRLAPALVQGIGAFDDPRRGPRRGVELEPVALYADDIGRSKAIALAQNLQRACTYAPALTGHVLRLEEALDAGVDLACDVVVCGVDNNPTCMLASRT